MSTIHTVKSFQKIPASLERTWAFFSNPNNLLAITPPFLNLKVTNEPFGNEAYAGQIITYIVKPLLGVPIHWMTEITHIEPLKLFVDEQRRGPYKLWHHQHHFKTIENGVAMTDIVHYRLPLGLLGNIANAVTVKKKLRQIFLYRYQKINELFGEWLGQQMEVEIH
jgi:ligand-binding SRPBCC domain-containing protein